MTTNLQQRETQFENSTMIRHLKRLIIGSKILKDGTLSYTCNKSMQSWIDENWTPDMSSWETISHNV